MRRKVALAIVALAILLLAAKGASVLVTDRLQLRATIPVTIDGNPDPPGRCLYSERGTLAMRDEPQPPWPHAELIAPRAELWWCDGVEWVRK